MRAPILILLALGAPALAACGVLDPNPGDKYDVTVELNGIEAHGRLLGTFNRQTFAPWIVLDDAVLGGEALENFRFDVDISDRPNDDPEQYDIALVHLDGEKAKLEFRRGATNYEILPGEVVDSAIVCPIIEAADSYEVPVGTLSGVLNFSKIQDDFVEVAIPIRLTFTTPTEPDHDVEHRIDINYFRVDF